MTATVRTKEFHFPVTTVWLGGHRVATGVAGKPAIEVMPPPEFRGTDPSRWSPEDFFVAAASSCFAVTLTGLAERAGVELAVLEVDADGIAGKRDDGRFGFTRIVLRCRLEVTAGDVAQARELALRAEETCLVSASLDLPVDLELEIVSAV